MEIEYEEIEEQKITPACAHCGDECVSVILANDQVFCCQGCRFVYEMLEGKGLGAYYKIEETPGISRKKEKEAHFEFLDNDEIKRALVDYLDDRIVKVRFFIPAIHCASCLWLLERLHQIEAGVLSCRVNFLKKEVFVTFGQKQTSLRKVAELLSSMGYTPEINLATTDEPVRSEADLSLLYKMGVAGFAFGNIMLLSFPEYLGLSSDSDSAFYSLFGYLNLILSLPVVLYSGSPYWKSAWMGLKNRHLNMDVPISIGIFALFFRSSYEILTHSGAGYMDSLAGLVFFLLIGRWFQYKTHHSLSFHRDYRSYFPIAATLMKEGVPQSVPLNEIGKDDVIVVKNGEIIPADGVLVSGEGRIDYSFVSGEAEPVYRSPGEEVFAGGRQTGARVEIRLIKGVAQSYLTQLWNESSFKPSSAKGASRLADVSGKYFTIVIIGIALLTILYWLPINVSTAINAATSVLIIACPCAVALSIPFIYGNMLRILADQKFYLKHTDVIENIQRIDQIVFDKTGTITQVSKQRFQYNGSLLSEEEKVVVYSLALQSSHPVSRQIETLYSDKNPESVQDFLLEEGRGISGKVRGQEVAIGSAAFFDHKVPETWKQHTIVRINGVLKGYFEGKTACRPELKHVLDYFHKKGNTLSLLSGDNDKSLEVFKAVFPENATLLFRQSPKEKLLYLRQLKEEGKFPMMIGDGLNDAGALKESLVGLVVSENTNNFTPASDAIIDAEQFSKLPAFFRFIHLGKRLVFFSFALAGIYNIIGLSFAVRGMLSPLIAAILMPLSSVTIIVFGILSGYFAGWKMGLTGKGNNAGMEGRD